MKKTVCKQYLKETLTGSRRHYRNIKITADGHAPYFSKYCDVVVGLKWLVDNIPEAAAAVVSRRMRGEPMVPLPLAQHHSKLYREVDTTGAVKHMSIGYTHPSCRCINTPTEHKP